jgi:thiol-disulfide isomerase/thioredoxin
MKFLLKNSFLFLIAAIAFSGLTGCKSTTNSAKQIDNTNSPSNQTAQTNANQTSKNSEYPMFPSALLKAEIKKIDDSTFKLEDKKGSVILLNLWATWCGPCRGEMPHLIEMEDKFKSNNFEIVGLNTDDESVEAINSFAAQMKLNYQMAYASGDMMQEFLKISKFQGIPQSFLIDREGRLRGVFLGGGPKVISTMKETVEKIVAE